MNPALPARHRRSGKSAFTLIELLLVLVILAVLAAVIMPMFTKRSEQARVTATKTDISNIGTALEAYEIDNGSYPTTQQGLTVLVTKPSDASNWNGPYLKRAATKDPWSHAFIYASPGQHNTSSYDLSSVGPDGQAGTSDDVTNWDEK